MPYANLHTHSIFSDGLLLPRELLERILENPELVCFALTDHDTMSGVEPMFRALAQVPPDRAPAFVPGVEMTAFHPDTGVVHILGYFPHINAGNMDRELARVDDVLGGYCRACCRDRTARDFEGRVRKAHDLNIDGMAEAYDSPEEVIERIRSGRSHVQADVFARADKDGDAIQYPISLTYQDMIAEWENVLPDSTRERARLYCLRPDPRMVQRMTELLLQDGLEDEEARALGSSLQGVLTPAKASGARYLTPLQGLELLKQAGAVTSIAHPGIFWPGVSLELFDERVALPLIESGLDALEVIYPYHVAHRAYITEHYRALVAEHGIGMTGGTDFHGDERTTLDAVKLDPRLVFFLG